MTRRRAEINNRHSTYMFCGVIPLCNFQYRNRVRSITVLFCGDPSGSEPSLFFSNYLFSEGFKPIQDDFARMTD